MYSRDSTTVTSDFALVTRNTRLLPHFVYIAIIVILGFVLTFLATRNYIWPHVEEAVVSNAAMAPTIRLCSTEACKRESINLTRQLSRTHQPCGDFYSFVCSKWMERLAMPRYTEKNSVDYAMSDKVSEMLDKILTVQAEDNLEYVVLSRLYKEGTKFRPGASQWIHKLIFKVLGIDSWPLPYNFVVEEADGISKYVGRSLYFDDGAFFRILPARNKQSTQRIVISEPKLIMGPFRTGRREDFRFVREVLFELALEDKGFDPLKIERMLAESMIRPPYDATALRNASLVTLCQLPSIQERWSWSRIIREAFSLPYDPALMEVLVESKLYLRNLATVLQNLTDSEIINYIVFHALMTNVLRRDNLGSIESIWSARISEWHEQPSERYFASRWIEKLEPALTLHVLHYHLSTSRVGNDIDEVKTLFRKTFLNSILNGSFPKAFTSWVQGQYLTLSWSFVSPLWTNDQDETEEYINITYGSLIDSEDDWDITDIYTNYLDNRFRKVFHYLSKDVKPYDQRLQGDVFSFESSLNFHEKVLEIPPAVFDLIRADEEELKWLHIPRAGPRVYNSLVRFLYYSAFNYERDRLGDSIIRNLELMRQCLQSQYRDMHSVLQKTVSLNTERTSFSDLMDVLSADLTYKAYNLYMRENDFRLKGLERLNGKQLFFVYYAANYCEKSSNKYEKKLSSEGPYSSSWHRVNGALRNMDEFSRVFRCSKGSFMNPEDKCKMEFS